jgi:hypothetical protein
MLIMKQTGGFVPKHRDTCIVPSESVNDVKLDSLHP